MRVLFEIGHEASVRSQPTSDGFTHDWHVFVRGTEHAEIHHFVEKVVFHLHETFPRPKRGEFKIRIILINQFNYLYSKAFCRQLKSNCFPSAFDV